MSERSNESLWAAIDALKVRVDGLEARVLSPARDLGTVRVGSPYDASKGGAKLLKKRRHLL